MGLSFAFGGDTNTSYEGLKRRQNFARLLMQRGASSSPKTAIEGINSAASSITGALLSKKIGAQQNAEQEKFKMLFGGAVGGAGSPSGGQGGFASQSTSGDAAFPVGTPATGDQAQPDDFAVGEPEGMAGLVRRGLIERGLPAHVADGFVTNFQDESGLNPAINEANPTVAGSRGGFGLAQWTGPRRKSLEQFAQSRGENVADANLQMDFLMTELQGSESRAARSIFASQDAGGAATAIVNDFLRPSEVNRSRRASRYSNEQPQSGPDPRLLALMGDPRASEAQRSVLGMLLQRQIQGSDPMRQLQMQKLQSEVAGAGQMTPFQQATLDLQQSKLNAGQDRVGAQEILEDGSIIQSTPQGPRVFGPDGVELSGQDAADAVSRARERFVENQGRVNNSRRLGTLDADVQRGAAASGAEAAGKQAIDLSADAWAASGRMLGSASTMDEAINAIDSGAKAGIVNKFLPNITEQSASLSNAMSRMGLDIISATTFGALSEGELKLAMETAAPRDLEPAALRSWLVRKRDATEKTARMLRDSASFLSKPGNTLNMWITKNNNSRQAQATGGENAAIPDFRSMSDAELDAFIAENGNGQ